MFYPYVSNLTENLIEIDFNFVNKKKLSMGNEASYRFAVKEPSIIRSKELFIPMSDSSFPNNQTVSKGSVPSLITNIVVAEKTKQSAKVAKTTVKYAMIVSFILLSALTIAMQQFWGLFRTL